MRILWLIIVLLVVGYTLLDGLAALVGVKSAIQMSQLYDGISATMLTLIALTLAFWFVADRRQPTQPPATPATSNTEQSKKPDEQ